MIPPIQPMKFLIVLLVKLNPCAALANKALLDQMANRVHLVRMAPLAKVPANQGLLAPTPNFMIAFFLFHHSV